MGSDFRAEFRWDREGPGLAGGVWWTEGQGKEALGRTTIYMRVPRLLPGSGPTVCPKLGSSGQWDLSG